MNLAFLTLWPASASPAARRPRGGCARLAHRGLALLLLSSVLSGCAVVGVSTISPSDYLSERRGDVLTTGRLSPAAQEVLRVVGIADCREAPAPCRQSVRQAIGLTDEQRLSALAELWLEHALITARAPHASHLPEHFNAHDPVLDAWLESARHAYAYLFFTERRPGERAFEDRQTQVRDYYNYAVQHAVVRLFQHYQKHHSHQPQPLSTQSGNWLINSQTVQLPLGMGLPQELVPATSLRFTGLRNTYRRDGLGAPFVAVLPAKTGPNAKGVSSSGTAGVTGSPHPASQPNPAKPVRRAPVATHRPQTEGPQFSLLTVLLGFDGQSLDEVMNTRTMQLQLHDPYQSTHVSMGHEQVPLAANFTAGYGLWLARSNYGKQALRTLLGMADGIVHPTVKLMQPWDPKRRIVVMLHGLASSPEAWANVANEVMGDTQLRDHYQIWHVYYPTNAPVILNLHSIRAALQAKLAEFDPTGQAPASNDVVLVGHSMGGVLARLLVSRSDEQLWGTLPEALQSPQARQQLERAGFGERLRFEPLPFVQRAIFIAAPHRGTAFADQRLARMLANLITLPIAMLDEFSYVTRMATQYGPPGQGSAGLQSTRIPTSIDNLSDQDPFMRSAADLPIRPGLPHHSIVGRIDPRRPLADSSDGIVPYHSAHLPSAQSERVITSGHSVQEHPAAILEIRRLLHLHLNSLHQPRPLMP